MNLRDYALVLFDGSAEHSGRRPLVRHFAPYIPRITGHIPTVIPPAMAVRAAPGPARPAVPPLAQAGQPSAPTERITPIDARNGNSKRTENATANPESHGAAGGSTDGRPGGSRIHRQIWNGHSWVLVDDDRIFRPAPVGNGGHIAASPAISETDVSRPLDPPPWTAHRRPELGQHVAELPSARTPTTTDDPLGRI